MGLTDGSILYGADLGPWTPYTPVWTASTTNPVIGNGTISGLYVKVAGLVVYRGTILMGSTTTYGSGTYDVSVPVTMASGEWIGVAVVLDASTGTNNAPAACRSDGASMLRLYAPGGQLSPTVPFTWASGDRIAWTVVYQGA